MNKFDEFDRDFDRMNKFINVWFVFVALVMVALLCGSGFIAWKILTFLGVL